MCEAAQAIKERPILMSAPMVRATLAGIKTQTRRPVRGIALDWLAPDMFTPEYVASPENHLCPYGFAGDRLWVRENGWERPERTPRMMREGADTWEPYYFDADGISEQEAADFKAWGFKRRPSIHMPRWACRLRLEVTGVRVERLQDISEEDLAAEGIQELIDAGVDHDGTPRDTYRVLWESLHGAGSWDANPWVWVVEFRRLTR